MNSSARELPVLNQPTRCASARDLPIRPSKMSAKRFTVLIVVQLLMLAHVVQWLLVGTTVAPVEPSESMETVKHGIVTVGFIVFTLGIISTAILGRWFCGWGCHIIFLQDWCGHLLHRAGIKPKAFKSRFLRYLPLALALYMFVWPIVYRVAVAPYVQPDLAWPGFTSRLMTTDFWATFPGWITAIPFLLVCGFLTVYFLGQKGYCTYACPYAGIFVPVEPLAIGRIRVSDACEGCGHCTAVCTSNVRVHEEVALYGMVVDPGCMKCMDCVSVCPKEALSFGFGKPAAGRPVVTATPHGWDLSVGAESFIALAAMFAFYAVYFPFGDSVAKVSLPLLFASGVAVSAAFMAWKSAQIVRRRPTGFHRWNFVRNGRITRVGLGWLLATGIVYVALANTLATNIVGYLAFRNDLKVQVSEASVYSPSSEPLDGAVASDARRALDLYRLASSVASGGLSIAIPIDDGIAMRRAWLHAVLREFKDAEAMLAAAWEREPREPIAIVMGRVLRASGATGESDKWYLAQCSAHPSWLALEDEHSSWLVNEERFAEAVDLARQRAATAIDADLGHRRLSMVLIEIGSAAEVAEGVALAEASLSGQSSNPFAHAAIATGYLRLQRPLEAIAPLRRALELSPEDPRLHEMLAQALDQSGDSAGAQAEREHAEEIHKKHPH